MTNWVRRLLVSWLANHPVGYEFDVPIRRLLLVAHVPETCQTVQEALPWILEGSYLVVLPVISRNPLENAAHLKTALATLNEVLPLQYGGKGDAP